MLLKIFYAINCVVCLSLTLSWLILYVVKKCIARKKLKLSESSANVTVGIFHPYCNAGGGGERVLWCAVRAIQAKYDNVKIIIYTGDTDASPTNILEKVHHVFNISLDCDSISFVYLTHRKWIEAKCYPYFTLLGQGIGSIILGMEALMKFPPNIYIDTMGYAFTMPIFRFLGNCKIGCYVHYPTISTDMLRRVKLRQFSHNNQNYVVRNPFITWLKLLYYRLFAKLYSLIGRSADTVMVNSSWTENHILELWGMPFKTHRVYPPCEIYNFQTIPKDWADKITILSVGQFRPEKNHPLQLQTMYELRTLLMHNEDLWNKIRLVIIGSCRNEDDYNRLKNMQDLAMHLSLENTVEFKVNVSYNELLDLYKSSNLGIHTMWNEHFGIGIVECMSAGLIMIAHRSGGPLLDIIETSEGSQNGFLAEEALEYASCIHTILNNPMEENLNIQNAAISSVERFSEKEFEINFLRAISSLFKNNLND